MSSDGSEFFEFVEMKLPFETLQQPYPPLWTAGNVEAAGRRGHHVIFPTALPKELRARYDELRAASGGEVGHQSSLVKEPRIAQVSRSSLPVPMTRPRGSADAPGVSTSR